jgi:hypothetical protein
MKGFSPQKRHKVQIVALSLAVLSPFGVYSALQAGQNIIAVIMGGLYLTAMLLAILVG